MIRKGDDEFRQTYTFAMTHVSIGQLVKSMYGGDV